LASGLHLGIEADAESSVSPLVIVDDLGMSGSTSGNTFTVGLRVPGILLTNAECTRLQSHFLSIGAFNSLSKAEPPCTRSVYFGAGFADLLLQTSPL